MIGYRTGSVLRAPACVVVLVLAGSGSAAEAQRPPPASEGRALEVGPRIAYDYREEVMVVGAQLRLPVDPWQRLDLMPSIDLTFRSGFTERQYNLDGAFFLDGDRSLYLGGGAAFRNTFFLDEDGGILDERETRVGYSLFGGLHGGSAAGTFIPQIEARWSFVDDFEPRTISLGLNYPIPLGF